ncbi:MAG TPA: hypothetical protein PKA64_26915 [Myxococcota bacterium]|nr:hypothetical protein [Myxococcota bacterium]
MLHAQLAGEGLDLVIAGVNAAGLEYDNPIITAGRALPWLQDPDDGVWRSYGAEWRDLFAVVGGVVQDKRNLTEHDLTQPEEADALAEMLRGL